MSPLYIYANLYIENKVHEKQYMGGIITVN